MRIKGNLGMRLSIHNLMCDYYYSMLKICLGKSCAKCIQVSLLPFEQIQHSHCGWERRPFSLIGFLYLVTTENFFYTIFSFKHGRWKSQRSLDNASTTAHCWWIRCRRGYDFQPTWDIKTVRYSCLDMFKVFLFTERPATSNNMWSSLLPTMHRTNDKWRVSTCVVATPV